MAGRVNIWLAATSKYAKAPYHSNQVALYFKFTELIFNALKLPSTVEFMERLAESLVLIVLYQIGKGQRETFYRPEEHSTPYK